MARATRNGGGPQQRRGLADPKGEFPFHVVDYVPHLIAAISQFRDSALDRELRKLGLNVGRYRVLGVLNRFNACTMTELAHFTAIDRTTLTRIADHLVEGGQCVRLSDPKDRRQVRLELTPDGAKLYRKGVVVVFELNGKLLEGLGESSSRSAARVLQGIVRNLAPNEAARDSIIHFSREALKGGSGRK